MQDQSIFNCMYCDNMLYVSGQSEYRFNCFNCSADFLIKIDCKINNIQLKSVYFSRKILDQVYSWTRYFRTHLKDEYHIIHLVNFNGHKFIKTIECDIDVTPDNVMEKLKTILNFL